MRKQNKNNSKISRGLKAYYKAKKERHNRYVGAAKHYWNKIRYFSKRLAGDDKKAIKLRKQALKLYNVKISAIPKQKQLQRLYRKMKEKRESMTKRAAADMKKQLRKKGKKLTKDQYANIQDYAESFYGDSDEGSFQSEVDT